MESKKLTKSVLATCMLILLGSLLFGGISLIQMNRMIGEQGEALEVLGAVVEASDAKYTELAEEVKTVTGENSELKAINTSKGEKIRTQNRKIMDYKKQLSQNEALINSLQEENDKYKQDLAVANEKASSLNNRFDRMLDSLRQENEILRSEIDRLSRSDDTLTQGAETIADMEAVIGMQQDSIRQLVALSEGQAELIRRIRDYSVEIEEVRLLNRKGRALEKVNGSNWVLTEYSLKFSGPDLSVLMGASFGVEIYSLTESRLLPLRERTQVESGDNTHREMQVVKIDNASGVLSGSFPSWGKKKGQWYKFRVYYIPNPSNKNIRYRVPMDNLPFIGGGMLDEKYR